MKKLTPFALSFAIAFLTLSRATSQEPRVQGRNELAPLTQEQLSHDKARIATVQIDSPWVWTHPIDPDNDPADKVIPYIRQAAEDGCDLVCFPELFLGMFRIPSPQTQKIADAAKKNHINVTIGCFEVDSDSGEYRNSILVFSREGKIAGRYFKAYQAVGKPPYLWPPIADDPEWMMKPGNEFPTIDLDFGRIGILTCYDGYFPEIWRLLSLKGAEIILWPNARGGSVEDYLVRSAVAQNYVHVVTSNKSYGSGTMIASWPKGILEHCKEPTERLIAATLPLKHLREGRINSREFHQRRASIHRELAHEFPVWEYYGKEKPVGLSVPKPDNQRRRQILNDLGIDLSLNQKQNDSAGSTPELWLGHYNPERLGDPKRKWEHASKAIDGIEFYINMIAYKTPEDELSKFCDKIRQRNLEVGVSGGYFDWEAITNDFSDPSPDGPIRERERMECSTGVGEVTARIEMRKLEGLIQSADGIDLICLDGPIRRLMFPGADTGRATPKGSSQGMPDVDSAVEEIIAYMRVWQESHPSIRFSVLTNFPNWGWNGEIAYWGSGPKGMYWGDYHPAIVRLIERCKETGVALDGIRVDHPFEFATGEFQLKGTKWPRPLKDPSTVDWLPRILELESIVRSAGLKFELIVNSEYGGATSNESFANRSLEYLDLYHSHGGRPDRYVLEGWYQFPDRLGPDTQPFTLSNTALEFQKRIEQRE